MNIIHELHLLQKQLFIELQQARQENKIEAIKRHFLGRKGSFAKIVSHIQDVKKEDRKDIGTKVQDIKNESLRAINQKLSNLKVNKDQESYDVTMPSLELQAPGKLHPISQLEQTIWKSFSDLNFDIVKTPEIDTEYNNFEALNMPENHPARDMQDTFYLTEKDDTGKNLLLRTHTSNTQARYAKTHKPPFRVIVTGKCYRRDADLTHTPMFHQFEGLWIDKKITMADLKGLLETAMSRIMERKIAIRFRISYFPFVEPGAEFDVTCTLCNGKGCKTCKQTGWLEMGGCGMVHKKVLENIGLDSDEFQGIAWGFGIERPLMIKHQVSDIRHFFQNDLRFLRQF